MCNTIIAQDDKKRKMLEKQRTKMLHELQELILMRDVYVKKITELEMSIDMIERRLGYVPYN